MRRGFVISAVVFAVMTAGMAASASASIVVNGSFEAPVVAGSFDTLPPPSIPGWTITSVAGSGDLIGSYWPAYDGNQSLDLDGDHQPLTLYQDLNTTAGQLYELTFAYANNPDDHPGQVVYPPQAQVTVTGNSSILLQQTFSHAGSTHSNMNWTLASFSFVANSATTKLEFSSLDNPGTDAWGVALDAVSVSAIPEPASLVVWSLVGIVGILHWRRRRKVA